MPNERHKLQKPKSIHDFTCGYLFLAYSNLKEITPSIGLFKYSIRV